MKITNVENMPGPIVRVYATIDINTETLYTSRVLGNGELSNVIGTEIVELLLSELKESDHTRKEFGINRSEFMDAARYNHGNYVYYDVSSEETYSYINTIGYHWVNSRHHTKHGHSAYTFTLGDICAAIPNHNAGTHYLAGLAPHREAINDAVTKIGLGRCIAIARLVDGTVNIDDYYMLTDIFEYVK